MSSECQCVICRNRSLMLRIIELIEDEESTGVLLFDYAIAEVYNAADIAQELLNVEHNEVDDDEAFDEYDKENE